MNKSSFEKNRKIEKEQIPRVLWVLGFVDWDDFKRRVRAERIKIKSSRENKQNLIGGICRNILGRSFISNREYKELVILVEKEIACIERIISEARKNEELDSQQFNSGKSTARRDIYINRKILQDDHSEYEL